MRDNGGEHRHIGIGEQLGYMKGSPSLFKIPNLCQCVNHLTYIYYSANSYARLYIYKKS
jgi:hypothetical protein